MSWQILLLSFLQARMSSTQDAQYPECPVPRMLSTQDAPLKKSLPV